MKTRAIILFLLAFVFVSTASAQNDYKVRLRKVDGNGGLISIQNAASRSAAETAALADGDKGSDTAAVDVERLDDSEAAARGQATQVTAAATKTSLDSFSAKLPSAATLADGASLPSAATLGAGSLDYNGATLDLHRGNINVTMLASGARTATPTLSDQTNHNGHALLLFINVTAVTGSPSVVFTIKGKDPVSGTYYTILASAAVTGTGMTVLRVTPFIAGSANLIAQDILPRTWAVTAVHGNTDSITYSIGYSLIN